MKLTDWLDNKASWIFLEATTMWFSAWGVNRLVLVAGVDAVARSIAPVTILFTVAVAIVVQLWLKLNDLSALSGLKASERHRLWTSDVRYRVRSLVWLVVFFVAFIFMVLAASALGAAGHSFAGPLFCGVGAGCGASLTLIAAVLFNLNEVAEFRWDIEGTDKEADRREEMLSRLSTQEDGFENDEHIQTYKRVIDD